MPEERKREMQGVSNTPKSVAECGTCLLDLVGAKVCQFATFDVVPDTFDWIQVRCVSGQPVDAQPVSLLIEESFHGLAAMGRQMIPNQNDFCTPDEALQLFEEYDEAFGVEAVRSGSGQQSRLLAVPTKTESCSDRRFCPVIPACLQDWRFPARCPGASH